MVWNKDKPAQGIKARDLDNQVRENNAALEPAIKFGHDLVTGGSQTGEHNEGAHKLYSGTTAPTKKEDNSTVLSASDYGRRLWHDTTNSLLKLLTAAATWTSIAQLMGMKDQDDMASNSDQHPATQQSIKAYVDTKDAQNVKLTGNQTVNGIKTFGSIPVLPNTSPTTDNQAARKKYVDDTYLSGQAVQVVNTQVATYSTYANPVIPDDDTIPQNTEGVEIMTLPITPKASANKLLIEVEVHWSASHDQVCSFGLFQDSTASALFACQDWPHTNWSRTRPMHFRYYMAAGTTSETTFKIRAGFDTSTPTLRINGDNSRKLGGVVASSITITEIKV